MKATTSLLAILLLFSYGTHAQFWKKKDKEDIKTDSTTESSSVSDKDKKGGPNLFTKMITKVAKLTGGAMQTATTDDLDIVVPSVYQYSNLAPGNLGTVEMAFFEGWKTGGRQIGLMFTKKKSLSFTKIDGTVKVDNKPAEFITMGIYSAFSEQSKNPQKVEVVTKSGDKTSFTILPPKHNVKIISINGSKAETINIDPSKDLVLEVENTPATEKDQLAVRVLGKTLAISYWSELGYFPVTNKIVIPAAYFRNINNTNGNGLTNFKKSYFSIIRSSREKATDVSGSYAEIEYDNIVEDGRYMNVSPDIEVNKGVEAKGENLTNGYKSSYLAKKTNAFSSMPFSKIKNTGVTSFSIHGTTSYYKADTKYAGNGATQERERSVQFPKFPDATWQAVLDELYTQLIPVIKEELNTTIEPLEKMTGAAAYQAMETWNKDDENTSSEFSLSYKNTKRLSSFLPLTEMYGANNYEEKLMKETNTNALINVLFNLSLKVDGGGFGTAKMIPELNFTLKGPQNGPTVCTKYCVVTVAGEGFLIKNKKEFSLNEVVKIPELIAAFRKSLQELKAAEKANGEYDIIWNNK